MTYQNWPLDSIRVEKLWELVGFDVSGPLKKSSEVISFC